MNNINYIFGKTTIKEAIRNNLKIIKIFATSIDQNIQKLNPSIQWKVVNNDYFNKFDKINHQNIVAHIGNELKHININELIKKLNKKQKSTVLMIDSIEDSRNFGAILRSAAAFGVDAVIYRNVNQSPINDLVIKTSMGGCFYLDFVKVSNLNQTIEILKKNGWWTYATNLADNSIEYTNCNFDNKSVIIVGNENHGISNLLLKNSDFNIKISINKCIQSLNVSSATAIIIAKRFSE